MAKILWSVDEKKYNDKNAHTLILTGWAASTEKKPCSFSLLGDDRELSTEQMLQGISRSLQGSQMQDLQWRSLKSWLWQGNMENWRSL